MTKNLQTGAGAFACRKRWVFDAFFKTRLSLIRGSRSFVTVSSGQSPETQNRFIFMRSSFPRSQIRKSRLSLPYSRKFSSSTDKREKEWMEPLVVFIEKHIIELFLLIMYLLAYLGYLLYTYDRSFRVHQETLGRILHWNNRPGLYCSRVHVGHEGTTL